MAVQNTLGHLLAGSEWRALTLWSLGHNWLRFEHGQSFSLELAFEILVETIVILLFISISNLFYVHVLHIIHDVTIWSVRHFWDIGSKSFFSNRRKSLLRSTSSSWSVLACHGSSCHSGFHMGAWVNVAWFKSWVGALVHYSGSYLYLGWNCLNIHV